MLLCHVSLIRKMAKDHSCQNIPWMSHLMPKSKWNEQLYLLWSLQIMWQGKEENNLSHEKWSLDCVYINQWFVIWAWDRYQAFKHELEVPNLLINQEIMCNQVNLSFHLPAEMLLSVDVIMRLNTPRADFCWGEPQVSRWPREGRGRFQAASLGPSTFLRLGEFLGSAPVKPSLLSPWLRTHSASTQARRAMPCRSFLKASWLFPWPLSTPHWEATVTELRINSWAFC